MSNLECLSPCTLHLQTQSYLIYKLFVNLCISLNVGDQVNSKCVYTVLYGTLSVYRLFRLIKRSALNPSCSIIFLAVCWVLQIPTCPLFLDCCDLRVCELPVVRQSLPVLRLELVVGQVPGHTAHLLVLCLVV